MFWGAMGAINGVFGLAFSELNCVTMTVITFYVISDYKSRVLSCFWIDVRIEQLLLTHCYCLYSLQSLCNLDKDCCRKYLVYVQI